MDMQSYGLLCTIVVTVNDKTVVTCAEPDLARQPVPRSFADACLNVSRRSTPARMLTGRALRDIRTRVPTLTWTVPEGRSACATVIPVGLGHKCGGTIDR